MASKSGQQEPEKAEVIEDLLDVLDTTLDRVRVLYEQYFLGIQKQPPAYLHTEVERRIREIAQLQIRNTALRYRFATLQQKFGAYHSYWRRTLRQIENGTYTRSLSKIGRQAVKTGAEVPEEILAAMPRRMREQVIRDREAALALAELRERQRRAGESPALAGEDVDTDVADLGAEDLDPAGLLRASTDARPGAVTAEGAHRIDESDADFDVDAFFASVVREDAPPSGAAEMPRSARPARPGSRPPMKTDPAPSAPPQGRQARPPPIPPRVPAATGGERPSRSFARAPSPVPSRPEPRPATPAPSQATRPLRVAPGAAAAHAPAPVETLAGPFPRAPSSPPRDPSASPRTPPPRAASPRPMTERGAPEPSQVLPPGVSDADVQALYAKYVEAKQRLGEEPEPGTYGKLLRTINTQAPKIMEQYKSRGVDFSVVVKDNQVILRAKPKP